MSTIEKKKQELEDFKTVRFVSSTLLEISAQRIKTLRTEFEKNQIFYAEVSNLYSAVKSNAIRLHEMEADVPKEKKAVAVAMTSNSRFYGALNRNIMEAFLDSMKEHTRDCVVIGHTGKRYMEIVGGQKNCQYLAFSSDHPSNREMRHFLNTVSVYDQVFVFYPTFVNAFDQKVSVLDINHTTSQEEARVEETEDIEYIFEPELPKILRFFETRVRHLLFYRAMLEAELARTAARLVAMQGAEERADTVIEEVGVSIRKEKETFDTMRLLESLAGITQWKQSQKHL